MYRVGLCVDSPGGVMYWVGGCEDGMYGICGVITEP